MNMLQYIPALLLVICSCFMYENAPFALLMFSDIHRLTFLYAIDSLICNNFHLILLYCIGNMWLYWYFLTFYNDV